MRVSIVPEAEQNSSQRPLYEAFAKRVGTNYASFKTSRDDGALLGPWSVWQHGAQNDCWR